MKTIALFLCLSLVPGLAAVPVESENASPAQLLAGAREVYEAYLTTKPVNKPNAAALFYGSVISQSLKGNLIYNPKVACSLISELLTKDLKTQGDCEVFLLFDTKPSTGRMYVFETKQHFVLFDKVFFTFGGFTLNEQAQFAIEVSLDATTEVPLLVEIGKVATLSNQGNHAIAMTPYNPLEYATGKTYQFQGECDGLAKNLRIAEFAGLGKCTLQIKIVTPEKYALKVFSANGQELLAWEGDATHNTESSHYLKTVRLETNPHTEAFSTEASINANNRVLFLMYRGDDKDLRSISLHQVP